MGHTGVNLTSEPTCKTLGLASDLSRYVISGQSSALLGSVSPSVKIPSFYTSLHVMNEATPHTFPPPALPFLFSAAVWGLRSACHDLSAPQQCLSHSRCSVNFGGF